MPTTTEYKELYMTEHQLKTIIRTELNKAGINNESLAKKTGINKSILSKWFNDHQSLKVPHMLKIFEVLDITIVKPPTRSSACTSCGCVINYQGICDMCYHSSS